MGPGALVREWVGTKLAAWLGLSTLDLAILALDEMDEIPLGDGLSAAPGPALVSRAIRGHSWGGCCKKELGALVNQEDIPRLVLFDTWTRNRDRHPPSDLCWKPNYDNVFFSDEAEESGKFKLIALDHTECFLSSLKPLDGKVDQISRTKDDRVYGLFPQFKEIVSRDQLECLLSAVEVLKTLDRDIVEPIIEETPRQWVDSPIGRAKLVSLVVQRAEYVSETIIDSIQLLCSTVQAEFSGMGE